MIITHAACCNKWKMAPWHLVCACCNKWSIVPQFMIQIQTETEMVTIFHVLTPYSQYMHISTEKGGTILVAMQCILFTQIFTIQLHIVTMHNINRNKQSTKAGTAMKMVPKYENCGNNITACQQPRGTEIPLCTKNCNRDKRNY